jgi:hypothetical protein
LEPNDALPGHCYCNSLSRLEATVFVRNGRRMIEMPRSGDISTLLSSCAWRGRVGQIDRGTCPSRVDAWRDATRRHGGYVLVLNTRTMIVECKEPCHPDLFERSNVISLISTPNLTFSSTSRTATNNNCNSCSSTNSAQCGGWIQARSSSRPYVRTHQC